MSTYKPKTKRKNPRTGEKEVVESRFYHFDFVIGGERFHGSTGQLSKRAADQYEAEVRRKIASGEIFAPEELSLDQAAGEWWEHHGQHLRSAKLVEAQIAVLLELKIPKPGERGGRPAAFKTLKLSQINTAVVRDVIAARRRVVIKKSVEQLSNASLNRTVIADLKRIINHAAAMHDLTLPKIAWKTLALPERKRSDREFSKVELLAWFGECQPVERIFLLTLLRYGPRFGELFFPPDALRLDDPDDPYVELGAYKGRGRERRESRKDGSLMQMALLPQDARVLSVLAKRAALARLEVIWFEEDAETKRLTEITYYSMVRRLREAAERAGVKSKRLLHSARHHAATMIVRVTGDLRLSQEALGHSQIATTQKYAGMTRDQIRAGLATVSRTSPEALALEELKTQDNQGDS